MKRIVWLGVGLLLVLAATTGGYFLFKKFMHDRAALIAGAAQPPVRSKPTTETRTYTQKDLEEARKKGKPLPGTPNQPYQPSAAAANDAAVQQSLRTIEEINRINQMNQRLMEQQQRQQRQNR